MSGENVVNVRVEGPVGIIELNRPDKFNCLALSVFKGIDAALDQFDDNNQVRVIMVKSVGKHFCTGADLDEVTERLAAASFGEFVGFGHQVLQRLEAHDLPVVGVCQGLSLAGGLELMLGLDVIFAGESSRFGDQHAQYGLVPGWGGSQRLPRIVGARRALDLLFSARWLSSKEALDWGLVNYVVPDEELDEKAMEYCLGVAKRSPSGLAEMKRLMYQGLEGTLKEGLKLEEDAVVAAMMRDENVKEGLSAFSARREPHFKK